MYGVCEDVVSGALWIPNGHTRPAAQMSCGSATSWYSTLSLSWMPFVLSAGKTAICTGTTVHQ